MIFECYLKEPLLKKIEIEKLGITISCLSEKEKTKIIQEFDEMYFSKATKRYILKHNKLYSENDKMKYYNYFSTLNIKQQKECLLYYEYLENNKVLNKKDLKHVLNRIVRIEINEKISEFIEENYVFFINNLIKYLLYIKNTNKEEELDDKIYAMEERKCTDEVELTVKYFNKLTTREPFIDYVDLNYNDFNKFNCFLNKINKSRIRDLMIIIETLFNIHNVHENKIISDVSILERLLIKHDNNYDIGKQFNLKVGLLLREYDKNFKDEDVKNLSYCYAVRSHILHGNDIGIYKLPEKYLKIKQEEWEKFFENLTIRNKREQIFFRAYCFLREYMRLLLEAWMNNTEKIEFLKNN